MQYAKYHTSHLFEILITFLLINTKFIYCNAGIKNSTQSSRIIGYSLLIMVLIVRIKDRGFWCDSTYVSLTVDLTDNRQPPTDCCLPEF